MSGTCDDEDLRIAVGALALGALDPEEAREVRQHMAGCPECQAEYTAFAGVKRVMDIGLVGAPMPGGWSAQISAAERAKARKALPFRTSPRRTPFRTPRQRRFATAAAGCAAALLLVFGGFWAGHGDRPPAAVQNAAATVLPAVTDSGVTAQISYQGHGWGTWVDAKMSGTPDGLNCTLYVFGKNHVSYALSSWRSVSGKALEIPAATALTPDQIDHFQVRVDDYGYDITVPMTS